MRVSLRWQFSPNKSKHTEGLRIWKFGIPKAGNLDLHNSGNPNIPNSILSTVPNTGFTSSRHLESPQKSNFRNHWTREFRKSRISESRNLGSKNFEDPDIAVSRLLCCTKCALELTCHLGWQFQNEPGTGPVTRIGSFWHYQNGTRDQSWILFMWPVPLP